MKKAQLVGLALLAVLAFCAFTAVSASAKEYLVQSSPLAPGQQIAAETTGTVFLLTYDKANPTTTELSELAHVLNEIECAGGTFDGLLEAELAEIQELLNSAGTLVSLAAKVAILCSVLWDGNQNTTTDCEVGTNNAEVFADNLPWDLALVLTTDWESKFPATAGYEVVCKALIGITGEGLCEGAQTVLLTNEPAAVPPSILAEFQPLPDSELASCTLAGIAQGKIAEVDGMGDIWALVAGARVETALS